MKTAQRLWQAQVWTFVHSPSRIVTSTNEARAQVNRVARRGRKIGLHLQNPRPNTPWIPFMRNAGPKTEAGCAQIK